MNELTKLIKGAVIGAEKAGEKRRQSLASMASRLGVAISQDAGQNTGARLEKIILLFDATGSMCGVWQEARAGIEKLVKRFREMFPGVELGMIAFRDYCDGQNVLQVLNFTASAGELERFINSVVCDGGGDVPEAVEVALERLLELKPDLGILVGDAPPHGVVDSLHGNSDFREIARRLGRSKIPIYTISTNGEQPTVSSFNEIAELSGGRFFRLEQLDELIDLLSVAAAKRADRLLLLQRVMEKEGGGWLTDSQKRLLLEAAK